MIRQEVTTWDEKRWEKEYESLMEIARNHLSPAWKNGEVVVLKTTTGGIYVAEIPNYQNPEVREPLENQCIQTMAEQSDTEVLACLATVNGKHPDILSWNFRSRLIELNENNLQTENFLWGGGENILLKSFSKLLPPNYQI